MEVPFMAVAAAYLTYVAFQGFTATYLVARAVKTRAWSLLLLSAGLFSMVIDAFIVDFQLGTPEMKVASMMNYPVFYVLFTKRAFYNDKKSAFVPVLTVIVVLRIIHAIEVAMVGFSFPQLTPVALDRAWQYWLHMGLVTALHVISLGWFAGAAATARRASKQFPVDPWVRARNKWVFWGVVAYAVLPVTWVLIPLDGTAYTTAFGFSLGLIGLGATLFHAATNALFWTMPGWFARWLDRSRPAGDRHSWVAAESIPDPGKVLTRREILAVVDYLGTKLAECIHKSPSASKGLLFMAIQKERGEQAQYTLSFPDLTRTVNGSLRAMLSTLDIPRLDEVIGTMHRVLVEDQALLAMMTL